MAANFQIPLDSIFAFIKDKVLGEDEGQGTEETLPTNDEENA
jgi:hypothetical protein